MRKPFALAAVLPLVLTAAACGSSDSSGSTSSGPAGKKVVYVQGMSGIPFYQTVSCGAAEAAKAAGIEFSSQGASEWDVAKQTQIVDALVASKPDAIMISVTDTKAMIAPLIKAKAAGIPIIGIDDNLQDESVMNTYIQSDSIEGGKLAGKKMGELLGGKGAVMALNNEPGTPIGDARVDGFKQGIAEFPGIKFLGVQYTQNTTAKAANITSTTATSNAELNGIFGVTTNNTEGAVTGLREAKKTGAVKVVGYDTSDPIVEALKNGAADALVVQYPFGEGKAGIDSAQKIWAKQDVPKKQSSPFVVATKDNLSTPEVQEYIYKMDCA
ncbi:substrate-binding domain-containing protein [Actinoplanes bogorensis]|uniref:Substrate-binding domain-containing protein n=1 Tax=Paractinoplanes bogorensis TaxID=1610840 RepID=A0ABS5YXG5_9ACTN|nr:ABC transporter substrate-binding protein [Actinoplanes bogorensis]MBU2668128.1 substrate-binding domain-containing protein [Actinoplanes bogorensis]